MEQICKVFIELSANISIFFRTQFNSTYNSYPYNYNITIHNYSTDIVNKHFTLHSTITIKNVKILHVTCNIEENAVKFTFSHTHGGKQKLEFYDCDQMIQTIMYSTNLHTHKI